MNSIARSSLSSLLYLLFIMLVVKLSVRFYPNADVVRFIKFVFLIPAFSLALWNGWISYNTTSRRVRARAYVVMLFWSALPPFFVLASDIDTRLGPAVIYFSLIIVISSLVGMVIAQIGPAIIPWIVLAVAIHGLTLYYCLVDPTHLAPIYVALHGLTESTVLYLTARFKFPRILNFSTLLPPRQVLHRHHHPRSVIPRVRHY